MLDELTDAIRRRKTETVKKLLDESPELLNSTDKEGNTPLHIAAKYNKGAIAKYLIQKKPELVDAQNNNGDTVAHIAFKLSATNVIKYLIGENKGNWNITNQEGDTPWQTYIKYYIGIGKNPPIRTNSEMPSVMAPFIGEAKVELDKESAVQADIKTKNQTINFVERITNVISKIFGRATTGRVAPEPQASRSPNPEPKKSNSSNLPYKSTVTKKIQDFVERLKGKSKKESRPLPPGVQREGQQKGGNGK
ncbi:MAG: ankyrin repeat domain-containing protein [Rickettsiaceae bacterium]|nr:ankyrin repeat domain-containing protein [Rickettsiaceae bacterium]